MRPRHLLLALSLLLPIAAYADTFTTTITGGGYTIIFPNVGGPTNYSYYPRGNEIQAAPLAAIVNGAPTQGELDFFLSTSSSYNDLLVSVQLAPNQTPFRLSLFGPNLITTLNGGFYSAPGTYNLTDSTSTPYTFIVTQSTPSAVPEPSTLSLFAIAIVVFLSISLRKGHRSLVSG